MTPVLRTFRCPHCALSVQALAGSTVTHECPANQRRSTQLIPQHPNQQPARSNEQ